MDFLYFLVFWTLFVSICSLIIFFIPDHDTSEDKAS